MKLSVNCNARGVQDTKRVSDQIRPEELRTETECDMDKENMRKDAKEVDRACLRRARTPAENCARLKDLGYVASTHIAMYGERFELISDPVQEGDCIVVQVPQRKRSNNTQASASGVSLFRFVRSRWTTTDQVWQETPLVRMTARHGGGCETGGMKCVAFGNERVSWAQFIVPWVKV